MDMMGMIGYLAVYTVQEISAEDRSGVWLGGVTYHCWAVGRDSWMWLHICLTSGMCCYTT